MNLSLRVVDEGVTVLCPPVRSLQGNAVRGACKRHFNSVFGHLSLPSHVQTLTPPHSLAHMCSSWGTPQSFPSNINEPRLSQSVGTLPGCAAQAPTCLQSQLQVHQQRSMSYFFFLLLRTARRWSDKPPNRIFLKELCASCLKPSSLPAEELRGSPAVPASLTANPP